MSLAQPVCGTDMDKRKGTRVVCSATGVAWHITGSIAQHVAAFVQSGSNFKYPAYHCRALRDLSLRLVPKETSLVLASFTAQAQDLRLAICIDCLLS